MGISNFFKKHFTSQSNIIAEEEEEESIATDYEDIRTATNRIIDETDYNKAESLNESDQLSRQRSDMLYEDRQRRIASFDPYSPLSIEISAEELTSTEKYFLKHISGQPVTNTTVPAYWFYEYSLDYPKIMSKLLSMRYLGIGGRENCMSKLTVPELKAVLSNFNLKISGKKSDLLNRISENITFSELEEYFINQPRFYYLTKLGEKAVSDLPESATKDIEFEDACLDCIMRGDVKTAYKLVCNREINKVIPRGLGTDWKFELKRGLPEYKSALFSAFQKTEINLPSELVSFERQFKACCIFSIMLGIPVDIIAKTFRRITETDESAITRAVLIRNLQKFQFAIMEDIQFQSINN